MVVVPGLHAARGARVGKGDQPLRIHASNHKAMDHVTLEMHKDIWPVLLTLYEGHAVCAQMNFSQCQNMTGMLFKAPTCDQMSPLALQMEDQNKVNTLF